MNTIKCCISCILPCGSLDVIRIVHVNGYVEEIRGSIQAYEIMKANPIHVLKSSSYTEYGLSGCSKIVILSPDDELQRGKIYFLVPGPKPSKAHTKSSTSLKKVCNKRSGRDIAWKPRLDSISEATSDT
ncbi:hypothetical protein QVD17_18016 [Tagetes erecta]|uniref:Uncharacterized protein n=1 Tax=Tagetes erecta TaxID=13708 RepID=A0AAD8NNK2_TARER|nr:hypothetical protein QVD17_18016 [Tagetes erecta]